MAKLNGSVGAIVFFALFVFFTCLTVVYYERNRAATRRLLLLRASAGFGRDEYARALAVGGVPIPLIWDVWVEGREEGKGWHEIRPFSASIVHSSAHDNPSVPLPSAPQSPRVVIQVGVTIAMPQRVEEEAREYHIGVAELPWT